MAAACRLLASGHSTGVLVDVVVLVAGAAAVWAAGTRLSRDADQLAQATGWGRVTIGALLLGLATSLPEIATTVTAGVLGEPQLAIGNLLGGVALQVVILAVADVVESDQRLMFQISRPTVLFQHVAVLVLLSLATAAMVVGEPVAVAGVGLWPIAITGAYAANIWLLGRSDGAEAWSINGRPPTLTDDEPDAPGRAPRPPAWRLVGLGAVILAAGWLVATTGQQLAESPALSGTFVGAALIALVTSLPELSTVIGSLRTGAYDMAVANIMGTNGLEVALLAVADVSYRDGPILDHATDGDVFLASLASVLTGIYLGALLLRNEKTVLRVGYDSAAVAIVYLGGMAVLATI